MNTESQKWNIPLGRPELRWREVLQWISGHLGYPTSAAARPVLAKIEGRA